MNTWHGHPGGGRAARRRGEKRKRWRAWFGNRLSRQLRDFYSWAEHEIEPLGPSPLFEMLVVESPGIAFTARML